MINVIFRGKLIWVLVLIAIAAVVGVKLSLPDANAAFCQSMSIPAYFYPGPLWDQATAGAPTVGIMIMNPASGPGLSQNMDYVAAVNKAQTAGVKVVGYAHTSYGLRDALAVKSEIDAYKTWYGVSGIFLDEVSSDAGLIPYYQDLADYIRATAGTLVMLNPGTIPDEGYMSVGDVVAVFEGTYNTYKNWVKPSWAANYPAGKFAHLVYAAPGISAMKRSVQLAQQRQGGNIYVTNDVLPNPWDTLPSYWSTELSEIKKYCG